jgi:hypothetical protein
MDSYRYESDQDYRLLPAQIRLGVIRIDSNSDTS